MHATFKIVRSFVWNNEIAGMRDPTIHAAVSLVSDICNLPLTGSCD